MLYDDVWLLVAPIHVFYVCLQLARDVDSAMRDPEVHSCTIILYIFYAFDRVFIYAACHTIFDGIFVSVSEAQWSYDYKFNLRKF